jgi:starch phosphorylase
VQEKVLGIGGVRLLRRLGYQPSVFHLNEGHSAFLTLELAREYLEANGDSNFNDAIDAVREQCVFTTHTPVEAGNDVFPLDKMAACFSSDFVAALKIPLRIFRARQNQSGRRKRRLRDDAARAPDDALGERRQRKTRRGFARFVAQNVSRGHANAEVPITHITNGVHAPTWIAPLFKIFTKNTSAPTGRKSCATKQRGAKAIDRIPDAEIWNAHRQLKQLLISFIRYKTLSGETGLHETINEHIDTGKLLERTF